MQIPYIYEICFGDWKFDSLQFPPTTNFRKCEQYNIITQTDNATTGKFIRLAMV